MNIPPPPDPSLPITVLEKLIRQAETADENLPPPTRLKIHAARLRGTATLLDRVAAIIELGDGILIKTLDRLTATEKELKELKAKQAEIDLQTSPNPPPAA